MKVKQSKDGIVNFFNSFPSKGNFKITKIKNTRPGSMVEVGNSVEGRFKLVEVQGDPAVYVDNSAEEKDNFYSPSYIRTSPIVAILDSSEETVTFQTEGGVYQLEKLKESKK